MSISASLKILVRLVHLVYAKILSHPNKIVIHLRYVHYLCLALPFAFAFRHTTTIYSLPSPFTSVCLCVSSYSYNMSITFPCPSVFLCVCLPSPSLTPLSRCRRFPRQADARRRSDTKRQRSPHINYRSRPYFCSTNLASVLRLLLLFHNSYFCRTTSPNRKPLSNFRTMLGLRMLSRSALSTRPVTLAISRPSIVTLTRHARYRYCSDCQGKPYS